MHAKTVPCGVHHVKKMVVFTATPNAGEHSQGAVSHVIGSGQLNIRSTSGSYGSIPIEGEEAILNIRDALIAICKMMKLPPPTC